MIQFNHSLLSGKSRVWPQPGLASGASHHALNTTIPKLPQAPKDSVHFGSSALQNIVNRRLVEQAGNGNLSAVSQLRRVDINFASQYNAKTALMLAAENDKVEAVNLLIRNKANIEAKDYDHRTALMLAARNGALNSVKALLARGARIYSVDKQGMNALLIAINCNRKEMASYFLDEKWNKETADYYGRTPLLLAAERGHDGILKDLIARKANLEAHNFENMTPLMMAAREGRTHAVRALVEAGAQLNRTNRMGLTPLMLAAREGHLEAVEILLENHANIDMATPAGDTALMFAASSSNPKTGAKIVKLLMEHGADVGPVNRKGSTPLMVSARLGYFEIVKMLLERPYEVKINQADTHGNTALHYAADRGSVDIIDALWKVPGLDLEIENNLGNTPLLMAAANGGFPATDALIKHDANVKHSNRRGSTALHSAGLKGQYRVAKLLLSKDAALNCVNLDGATPLLLATLGGHGKVMDLLIQHEGRLQRPYSRQFHQLQNYAHRVATEIGLDWQRPFIEHLPFLAKHDLFNVALPLFLAHGKPLAGLQWILHDEMDYIIRQKKPKEGPERLALAKQKNQAWKNIAFLTKHNVELDEATIPLALKFKQLADEAKAEANTNSENESQPPATESPKKSD